VTTCACAAREAEEAQHVPRMLELGTLEVLLNCAESEEVKKQRAAARVLNALCEHGGAQVMPGHSFLSSKLQ
jgi:hypothetical protein